MADAHHVVEAIRALLHPGQTPDEGTLRGLAEDYAAACAEANDRLLTCGLVCSTRGWGPRQSSGRAGIPGLLELVAALDFPERAAWDALATAHRLTPAPA